MLQKKLRYNFRASLISGFRSVAPYYCLTGTVVTLLSLVNYPVSSLEINLFDARQASISFSLEDRCSFIT